MRYRFCFLIILLALAAEGQIDARKNSKPKIVGQKQLVVDEDQSLTLQLTDLEVIDLDDWFYPNGFTMKAYPGNNYTITNALTISPEKEFSGTLNVPVTVNDGKDDSRKFEVKIQVKAVNDPPQINGQISLSTEANKAITILLSHLLVTDPDNKYPDNFTLEILPSNSPDYSVSGYQVVPAPNYTGTLSVAVRVSDGASFSNPYPLEIKVVLANEPGNDPPVLADLETEALIYQVGKGTASITRTVTITDADNTTLAWAEVGIRLEHYIIGSDELVFENTPTIKGTFDIQRAKLTLSGVAPISEYISAMRSIKYKYLPGAELLGNSKTLYMLVNDGTANSEIKERQIKLADIVINLDIPTAFTPNGDLANDTWRIKPLKQTEELSNAIVRVYTKHGKLVFEGQGFEKEWDGKSNGELLPADTYFYTIDFNLDYSKTSFKGLITILR